MDPAPRVARRRGPRERRARRLPGVASPQGRPAAPPSGPRVGRPHAVDGDHLVLDPGHQRGRLQLAPRAVGGHARHGDPRGGQRPAGCHRGTPRQHGRQLARGGGCDARGRGGARPDGADVCRGTARRCARLLGVGGALHGGPRRRGGVARGADRRAGPPCRRAGRAVGLSRTARLSKVCRSRRIQPTGPGGSKGVRPPPERTLPMRRILPVAAVLALALTTAACGSSDDTDTAAAAPAPATTSASPSTSPTESMAAGDIVDTAVAAGDFPPLAAALEAAGLVETLKGAGPYTVFAPTDAAFEKLPAGTVDTLLKDPKGDLTQILTYHVVEGEVLAADVVKLDGQKVATVQGGELTVNVDGDAVSLTDAAGGTVNVTATDVDASNGVIHVIDGVLMPK